VHDSVPQFAFSSLTCLVGRFHQSVRQHAAADYQSLFASSSSCHQSRQSSPGDRQDASCAHSTATETFSLLCQQKKPIHIKINAYLTKHLLVKIQITIKT